MIQCGVSPDYVLDSMEMYELSSLLSYIYIQTKEQWEMTRLIAYITAQCNSTKKLKPTDIIKFPWEEGFTPHVRKIDTKEEIEALREKIMKEQEQRLNATELCS